jgi:hypothetical protein
MRWKEIEKIMKEEEKYTKMLEEYDKTGVLPFKASRKRPRVKIK